MTPTPEQLHILNLYANTKDNLMVRALAGSGKTTTLELLHEATPTDKPVLFLAFNTRIRDRMVEGYAERRDKIPGLAPLEIKTMNGFGYGVWRQTVAWPCVVNKEKMRELFREVVREYSKPKQQEAYDEYTEIIAAASLAKSLGYIPEGAPRGRGLCTGHDLARRLDQRLSDFAWGILDKLLIASIRTAYAGNLDFPDQIYMPALFGGSWPKFPYVYVDEAQDLSPVDHEVLGHLTKSRIIAVGDPWQSIYVFRGAVSEGMSRLRERFQMTEATLSVSFRCPQAIVDLARWRAPEMKWSKPGGRVRQLNHLRPADIPDGAAILCRNNAPLFSLGLRLLSSGRSVSIAGSEIGPRVIRTMEKLGPEEMTRDETLYAIQDWLQEKLLLESKTAQDTADCMAVFARHGNTLGQAISYARHLLTQEGTIQLLTGHKAKGLEWETVYHLDPWLIRSDEQDRNLVYVIQTRSLDSYFEITSGALDWSEQDVDIRSEIGVS